MGATDRLLNADHEEVYFKDMPSYKGMQLRRHGDILKRSMGGYIVVQGRADDTMNLGGIKTSSVEIERVCNRADESVLETVAISVKPPNGGPEQLSIFVVLRPGISIEAVLLKMKFSKAIRTDLNPLFKMYIFSNSLSIIETLSVDMPDTVHEKNKEYLTRKMKIISVMEPQPRILYQ